jgi:hypothetical protein
LAERIIDFLDPIQKRYRSVASDRAVLDEILRKGAEQARERSRATLARVYEAIGLVAGRPDVAAPAPARASHERRTVMGIEETKELSTAAAAETDADAECLSDCCDCCCCDTEEECQMEA